ncbi:MAG: hypothetical protein GY869_15180, partial [Planctomycetes bacterium]|nr:hypothetical protein [Planctomycetota bacterium]
SKHKQTLVVSAAIRPAQQPNANWHGPGNLPRIIARSERMESGWEPKNFWRLSPGQERLFIEQPTSHNMRLVRMVPWNEPFSPEKRNKSRMTTPTTQSL